MAILILIMLLVEISGFTDERCSSPQYLELGKPGVINCSFPDVSFVISWFNSTSYRTEDPLAVLREGEKAGWGYLSGEYDVHQHGSLVIRNVSLEHEHTFTVVKLDNPRADFTPYFIEVVIIVVPHQNYPHITNCSEFDHGICYAHYSKGSVLECSFENVRPQVGLKWVVRTTSGDRNISHETSSMSNPDATFSSFAVLVGPFPYKLTLAVCKATNHPNLLTDSEALIILQNMDIDLPNPYPVRIRVMQGSALHLHCPSLTVIHLLVWNYWSKNSENWNMIVSAAVSEEKFISSPVSKEYAIRQNGSLIIPNVAIGHQGVYSCIIGNDGREDAQLYAVYVYEPAYPTVDGCNSNQYCVIHAEDYDALICRIRRVPEDVRLEFRVLSPTSEFLFMEQETTVYEVGDYYDVLLSSKIQIKNPDSEIVTIECGVTGTNKEIFGDTAILSVYIDSVSAIAPKTDSTVLFILIPVSVIPLIIVILIRILVRAKLSENRVSQHRTNKGIETGEIGTGIPAYQEPLVMHLTATDRCDIIEDSNGQQV